jgi:general secretion pathway protein G
MSTSEEDGFTFIETLIVLTIILIMSAGVGFSAMRSIERAKIVSCRTQISSFKMALESYYLDCGSYPSAAQGLTALWKKPVLAPVPNAWAGPYVDREIPTDPWAAFYIYRVPGENDLPYSIVSYGADGVSGGDDENQDIESWK